ncbi:hypothetical protein BKA83DRAFT_4363237, partial [Pisolithus microcarpus]
MTLPEVESALQLHLGDRFVDADWQLALKVVMDAEGDVDQALEAVDKLQDAAASRTGLKIKIPAQSSGLTQDPQAYLWRCSHT